MLRNDEERLGFLEDLDKKANEIEVTDWEAKFMASVMAKQVKGHPAYFSGKMQEVIDRMYQKYGRLL